MGQEHSIGFYIIFLHILYLSGIAFAIHALLYCRTAQATVAWVVSLVSLPAVAIPLYLIFGRNKFYGYVEAIRSGALQHNVDTTDFLNGITPYHSEVCSNINGFDVFQRLAEMPFTKGNKLKLLINGAQTFDEIFQEIENASNYIIIQFYIVHDDDLGRKLKERLIEKAKSGVKVYFLYDEIGSSKLPNRYVDELAAQDNIEIHDFKTTQGFHNRFQLNFRNHRKIVVIDGQTAFVGGHNVGDEYLGKKTKMSPWRDTHCRLDGPVVQEVQYVFLGDWYWACRSLPELSWKNIKSYDDGCTSLALPTGPADRLETGTLYFANAIQLAQKRLWIATPYFVPDPSIIDSLQLAALRGVDVRIIIPMNPDAYLPYLASFSFLPEIEESGIKIYRYKHGFMHQKIMLVDDDLSSIGTANFDNRSMRLNFEISILTKDKQVASEVERMLNDDINNSHLCTIDDYLQRGFWFQVLVQLFRLFSPVL